MYIDPNTGGVLFQALAAFFVAGISIFFVFSRRIIQFFIWLGHSVRKDKGEDQE